MTTTATTTAVADPAVERASWLVGGVAAELSDRLAVPVGFIRLLLVVGAFLQSELLLAYVLLALLLPHVGRRLPGAANVIALSRIGVLYLLVGNFFIGGGGLVNRDSVFGHGPAVWIPFAGATACGLAALLASGGSIARRDADRDRALARAIIAVALGVGLVALGVLVVPSLQWQIAIDALTVAAGAAVAFGGGRLRAVLVPLVVLGSGAILLASAGVRLQGGIGNQTVAVKNAGELRVAYRHAVGDLTLDLTRLRARASLYMIDASVGIGRLRIILPTGGSSTVDVRVGRGSIEVLTCSRKAPTPRYGFDERSTVLSAAQLPACGGPRRRALVRLSIRASVGIGTITISEPPFTVVQ